MASVLDHILYLRKVMQSMEADLGLLNLPQLERDIIYAAHDVADSAGCFEASAVIAHELTREVPKTSYHRAFNALLQMKVIQPATGFKARRYVICDISELAVSTG